MIVDSSSDEVVYTSLFTGVKGNYLARSVAPTGFDPDNLPEADKSKMDFGSGGNMEKKAWRDIWSARPGRRQHPRRAAHRRSRGADGGRVRGDATSAVRRVNACTAGMGRRRR